MEGQNGYYGNVNINHYDGSDNTLAHTTCLSNRYGSLIGPLKSRDPNGGTGTDGAEGNIGSPIISGYAKVYNAVWNDICDCITVPEDTDLEYGYCYCYDGSTYHKSRSYLEDGFIGIH